MISYQSGGEVLRPGARFGDVEDGEGGVEGRCHLRLAALDELRRHLWRDPVEQVDLPCLERGQGGVGVRDHDQADLVDLHVVRVQRHGICPPFQKVKTANGEWDYPLRKDCYIEKDPEGKDLCFCLKSNLIN